MSPTDPATFGKYQPPRPGRASEPVPAIAPPLMPHISFLGGCVGRGPVAVSIVVAILILHVTESNRPTKSNVPTAHTVVVAVAAPFAPDAPTRVALAQPFAYPLVPALPAAEPLLPGPDKKEPLAVTRASVRDQHIQGAAALPPTTQAAPSPRKIRSTMSTAPSAPVRPRPAAAMARASGCTNKIRLLRDICEVQQCRRVELRNTPVCTRILAGQRATLAQLHGTPD